MQNLPIPHIFGGPSGMTSVKSGIR